MSAVQYFRWDDAGAPSLTGEVGSLTNVLRKCLVGVGGVAYGAKASAGWSEAFIGAASNIAAFRNSAADGASECYVRVNDNASGAALAREAQVTVYGVMTDINTGTFGTTPVWHRKSSTADAVARKWLVMADAKTAWVHSYDFGSPLVTNNGFDTSLMGVGDYACVDPANALRFFCLGRATVNSNSGGDIVAFSGQGLAKSAAFTAQALNGITGIIQPSISLPLYTGTQGVGGSGYPGVHPITGDTFFMAEPIIRDGYNLLGRLRGLHLPYNNIMSTADGAIYPGYTGKVVCKTRIGTSSNADYHVATLVDTVGPWL